MILCNNDAVTEPDGWRPGTDRERGSGVGRVPG